MLTNGQTDGHCESRVLLSFYNNNDHCYALCWTPNAYQDMLMPIFTPGLFLQCVFNDFQCVFTLLRALSVALGAKCAYV